MCYGCWEESGGLRIDTQAVRVAATVLRDFDLFGLGGGNLHVVVDDWNLEDYFLDSCRNDPFNPPFTEDEQRVYDALRPLTEDERYSAMGLAEGYWG